MTFHVVSTNYYSFDTIDGNNPMDKKVYLTYSLTINIFVFNLKQKSI